MNVIGGIIIAALSGGLFFTTDHKVLAVVSTIISYLFVIGYFDPNRKQKKC